MAATQRLGIAIVHCIVIHETIIVIDHYIFINSIVLTGGERGEGLHVYLLTVSY